MSTARKNSSQLIHQPRAWIFIDQQLIALVHPGSCDGHRSAVNHPYLKRSTRPSVSPRSDDAELAETLLPLSRVTQNALDVLRLEIGEVAHDLIVAHARNSRLGAAHARRAGQEISGGCHSCEWLHHGKPQTAAQRTRSPQGLTPRSTPPGPPSHPPAASALPPPAPHRRQRPAPDRDRRV